MKEFLKYCAVLFLVFTVEVVFASVGVTGGDKAQEGQVVQQQQAESAKPSPIEQSEAVLGGVSGEAEMQSDTVVDDSVSKYNFILYFLYKFKYEEAESF